MINVANAFARSKRGKQYKPADFVNHRKKTRKERLSTIVQGLSSLSKKQKTNA